MREHEMPYIHACVFARFQDLSGLTDVWEKKCDSLLVVEHPAEGKTKRVHCHFLIETGSGENWFRDKGKEVLNEYFKRGNYWIALRVQKGDHAGKLIEREYTATYMLKKTLTPSFAKNFSPEEVEALRQAWVDKPTSESDSSDASEVYIELVMKKFDRFPTFQSFTEWYARIHHECSWDTEKVLSLVRTETMKMFYAKNRRVPPAMLYKAVAGSAFLRLCEKWNQFDNGITSLKNLWY